MKLLIVDDEPEILLSLKRTLKYKGIGSVTTCDQGLKALSLIQKENFDVVLLDIVMPEMDGLEILESAKPQRPHTEFIIISGVDQIDTAVRAVHLGAYDYLVKPLDPTRLLLSIERAYERRALSMGFSEMSTAESCLELPEAFSPIRTESPKMCSLVRYADLMARSGKPILLTGESGTGKEVFARSIHRAGPWAKGPFVPVNVSSVPASLFESQFFGHAKGAFTGALTASTGYFESADGGTLLLDEIGELSAALQTKLLRVLEEDQVTRLGETRPRKLDVQIISSTNKDLGNACNSGEFRYDLYFRLSSAKIHIPPLRQRVADIPLLAHHFLREANEKYGKAVSAISTEALDLLSRKPYPGNVRQLKQMMENAVLTAASGTLTVHHFGGMGAADAIAAARVLTLKQNEDAHIRHVLDLAKGDRKEAAGMLGISLRHLYRKLAAIKQSRPDADDGYVSKS
jgi:DNA-binding NtrC family response regulator